VKLLRDFYDPFSEDIKRAGTEMEKVGPVETDFDCPECGRKLNLRRGRFGMFFSCSGYPECKVTMNVSPEGEPIAREEKPAIEIEGIEPGATRECEKCGKPMVVRTSRRGAFWGCTGYPKCRNLIAIEGAAGTAPPVEETEHKCPNCGKPLAQRKGRFGPFLGCTGYPECKTIINLDKDGNPRWPAPADADADGASSNGATKAVKKASTKKTAAKAGASKAGAAKKVAVKKTATKSKKEAAEVV
jgi:DNA topoisomerase-1